MISLQSTFGASSSLLTRQISNASSSVGRLSSGNRIQQAKDDVSSLSVATTMQTQVGTLREQLRSAAQISSVLQVAHDGMANLQEVVMRMKTLALQASSGGITEADRSFLGQEFQILGQEADRIVKNTSFNGIKLLNSGKNIEASTALADKASAVVNWTSNPTNNQTFRVQNTYFRFRTNPNVNDPLHVQIGTTVQETVANLAQAMSEYDVTDRFKGFDIGASGNQLIITSKTGGLESRRFAIEDQGSSARNHFNVTGGQRVLVSGQHYYALESQQDQLTLGANSTKVVGSSNSTLITAQQQVSAEVRLTVANPTGGIANNQRIRIDNGFGGFLNFQFRNTANVNNPYHIQIGANNEESLSNAVEKLNAFQFITPTSNGHYREYAIQQLEFERDGLDIIIRHKGTGAALDYRFTNIQLRETLSGGSLSSTVMNNGVDSGISTFGVMNEDFIGNVSGFTADYITDDTLRLSLQVGAANYSAVITDTTFAGGNEKIYFTSENHGYFTVEFANGQGFNVTSQQDADVFAQAVDSVFSAMEFRQTRGVSNYNGAGSLDGSTLFYESADFSEGLNITSVSVQSAELTGGDAKVIIEANGKKFEYIERDIDANGQVVSNPVLTFNSISGSDEKLIFKGMNQKYDLNTNDSASTFATNLLNSLKQFSDSGIELSLNSTESSEVDVGYKAFDVTDLFSVRNIDINSMETAAQALDEVQEYMNKIIAQQADVGASQKRLDYLMAEKESSLQQANQARSVIADTDILSESTSYAQTQVLQNVNISMMAQANTLRTEVLSLLQLENSITPLSA